MFRLDVLQNQWLIFTLIGGAAILSATILLFVALWRPRDQAPRHFMPWLLILLFGAAALFAAVYVAHAIARAPNW
jgi:phosphoglycerol transferase MdoB-like AlkP superfamily enzyme